MTPLRHATCRTPTRRATVLFAVLFLVVIASLTATTMLGAVEAERASASRSLEQLELHAAARSALLVYLVEMDEQRAVMLDGGEPELSEMVEIRRGESVPPMIVTLLRGPGSALVRSEAGRLDLNHASPEMLAALPGMDAATADRIAAATDASPLLSPNEIARFLAAPADAFAAGETAEDSASAEDEAAGPLDLLTVHAADPQVQFGLDDEALAGEGRINLNAPWSDNTESAFASRASPAVAQAASELFIEAPALDRPSALVRLLIAQGVPAERWGPLLDTCTTTPDLFALGLVDINRAPQAVLAALPGLSDALAADLIAARQRLGPEALRNPAWPLIEAVVSPEQFAQLIDHITTRSLQWRITFRVSFGQPGESDLDWESESLLPDADEFGVAIDESEADSAEARGPTLVYEAVLDAAGSRTRLAYLRERTAYDFVADLVARGLLAPTERGPGFADAGDRLGAFEDPDDAWDIGAAMDEGEPFDEPMTLEELNASFFMDVPAEDDAAPGEAAGIDTEGDPAGRRMPLSFFDEPAPDNTADTEDASATGSPRRAASAGSGPAADPRDNRLGRWKPAPAGGDR